MLVKFGIAAITLWVLVIGFIWVRGGLGRGRRYGNKVAAHLGMKNNFFHSVLDNGVNGPSLQLLAALESSGLTLEEASAQLGPSLERGLAILEARFGRQEVIDDAKPVVARLVKAWEALQKSNP